MARLLVCADRSAWRSGQWLARRVVRHPQKTAGEERVAVLQLVQPACEPRHPTQRPAIGKEPGCGRESPSLGRIEVTSDGPQLGSPRTANEKKPAIARADR